MLLMSTTGSAISINNLHLHHWGGCTLPHCSKKWGVLPVDVEVLPQLWPLPVQVVLSLPFFNLFTLEWIISEYNCGFSFSLNRNFSPLEVWLREWGEKSRSTDSWTVHVPIYKAGTVLEFVMSQRRALIKRVTRIDFHFIYLFI